MLWQEVLRKKCRLCINSERSESIRNSLHTSFAKREWQVKKIIAEVAHFGQSGDTTTSRKKAGPLLTLPLVCNVIFSRFYKKINLSPFLHILANQVTPQHLVKRQVIIPLQRQGHR